MHNVNVIVIIESFLKIIIIISIKCFDKNVHINNITMLYQRRNEVPEGIDTNKKIPSKSVLFAIAGIFLDKGFKLQSSVCNCCSDVLMDVLLMPMNLNNITILKIHIVNYCCIIKESTKR